MITPSSDGGAPGGRKDDESDKGDDSGDSDLPVEDDDVSALMSDSSASDDDGDGEASLERLDVHEELAAAGAELSLRKGDPSRGEDGSPKKGRGRPSRLEVA